MQSWSSNINSPRNIWFFFKWKNNKISWNCWWKEIKSNYINTTRSRWSTILKGLTVKNNYVLHITGDFWIIENLKLVYAQKGIVLDNPNYSIIINVEIYCTGAEAIEIREVSSNCLLFPYLPLIGELFFI